MSSKREEKKSHSGHRQRLKNRFLGSHLRTFHDYELLEMMLFYVIPIRDTKSMAKALLDEYGSLAGVINAADDKLLKINGVGDSVILFFRILKDFYRL